MKSQFEANVQPNVENRNLSEYDKQQILKREYLGYFWCAW
jgi:hypothetical protein